MAESAAAAETPEPIPTNGTSEELETTTLADDTRPELAVEEQEEEASLPDGEAPTEKLPRIVPASSAEEETAAIEEPSSPQDGASEEPSSSEEPAVEELPTLVEFSSPQESAVEEPAVEEMPALVEPALPQKQPAAVDALPTQELVSQPEPAGAKEELPEALRMPSQALGGLYRFLLGLASLVGGIASITINQLFLPSQIAALDPAHQLTSLSLVAISGILAAFIVTPVVGALSDRTTGRLGRRRPWMLVGLIGGVAALLVMAFSTSILLLLAGEVLMQICFGIVYTMLTAVIPDQVSLRQRAIVSAAIGIAPVVGSVVGLLVVSLLAQGTRQGYFWLAAISFGVIALFLLVFREKLLAQPETTSQFYPDVVLAQLSLPELYPFHTLPALLPGECPAFSSRGRNSQDAHLPDYLNGHAARLRFS